MAFADSFDVVRMGLVSIPALDRASHVHESSRMSLQTAELHSSTLGNLPSWTCAGNVQAYHFRLLFLPGSWYPIMVSSVHMRRCVIAAL